MGLPVSETCTHDRVLRLSVPGTEGPFDYWICNVCNAQFIPKSRVDWKIEHLAGELLRLTGVGAIADDLFARLTECAAISPCYDEEAYEVIKKYMTWKATNEQAARMWVQEKLPL